MRRLFLILVLAACGGKSPPPAQTETPLPPVAPDAAPAPAPLPPPPAPTAEEERAVREAEDAKLDALAALAERMCNCPDKACGEAVKAERIAFFRGWVRPRPYMDKTPEQEERQGRLMRKHTQCSEDVRTGKKRAPDPVW